MNCAATTLWKIQMNDDHSHESHLTVLKLEGVNVKTRYVTVNGEQL